jgi:hypothetical protein
MRFSRPTHEWDDRSMPTHGGRVRPRWSYTTTQLRNKLRGYRVSNSDEHPPGERATPIDEGWRWYKGHWCWTKGLELILQLLYSIVPLLRPKHAVRGECGPI